MAQSYFTTPDNEYDYIKYCVPDLTKVIFSIKENDTYLKVLDGSGLLIGRDGHPYPSDGLKIGQEVLLYMSENVPFHVHRACKFIVKGQHCVKQAIAPITITTDTTTTTENTYLFNVSYSADCKSYEFVLDKTVTLNVLVGDQNSPVTLTNTEGVAESCGADLQYREHSLPPGSSLLVHSSRPNYGIKVEGTNRRITVIAPKNTTWKDMEEAFNTMRKKAILARQSNYLGPKTLVAGKRYIGRTSLCYFLINKAIESALKPVYIDLDVRGTSSNLSGAISFIETENQALVSDGFEGKTIMYYFGSTNPRKNYDLYYLLIQEVGESLNKYLYESKEPFRRQSGAVIDVGPTMSDDARAINFLLRAVRFSRILIISDGHYYNVLNETVGKTAEAASIENSPYIEEPNNRLQKINEARSVTRYFNGTAKNPRSPNRVKVKFSDIQIYSTVLETPNHTGHDAEKADIQKIPIRRVPCDPGIVNHVLGVSSKTRTDSRLLLTPVAYFVCVTDVDMDAETIVVLSPTLDSLAGKILVIGEIKMESGS